MANITAGLVKELRERSGCGMMDCKKVLVEADGDIERAAELLREKGLAKAVKKSGRIAAEGIVASAVSEDGKIGVIVEVNCETDFVAKADPFRNFVDSVAKIILEKNPADVDALLAMETAEGTVTDMLNEAVFKIGEKISIRRFVRVEGNVDTYIHMGGKIGVLVEADKEADKTAMHDVALQIAAAKPSYVRKEEVPAEEIEHEKMILREQALSEPKPKPEAIIEKMVLGRIQKYYKEVCLLEQPFVKDGDVSVAQMINNRFDIVKFARFEMGDGLEKRQDDFAAEVMAQMQK